MSDYDDNWQESVAARDEFRRRYDAEASAVARPSRPASRNPFGKIVFALVGTYGWWYLLTKVFSSLRQSIQFNFTDPARLQFFQHWNDLTAFLFICISCFVVFAFFCALGWIKFFRLTFFTLTFIVASALLSAFGTLVYLMFA